MTDIPIGSVIEMVKFCAPIIRKQIDFIYYKENVEKLNSQLKELQQLKDCIQDGLHSGDPKDHVAKWLDCVDSLVRDKATVNWEGENLKCLMGLSVNCLQRYQMNKLVEQNASQVSSLMKEGEKYQPKEISNTPSVEVMDIVSGYLETDMSKLVKGKIINALANESVKAIGVWGMGGVGKTELVKLVNNSLQSKQDFDKVIVVTISNNPDWETIRKQIGKRLGLDNLEYMNENSQIGELKRRSGKFNSVLFILDSVWEHFPVSKVGIPSDVKYKFIITTRDQSVCDLMKVGTQEQFELSPMSMDDSWKLFEAKAGCVEAAIPIAKKVCAKCGGLPLAICTLAPIFLIRNDGNAYCEHALEVLESTDQSGIFPIFKDVLENIELSFNGLSEEVLKICFLYCCSAPEGHRISKENIRNYAIGRKLMKSFFKKKAAKEVDRFVVQLKKCSLLIADEDESFVRVHDIVRQVGIWIASKEPYGFVVNSGQKLDELPLDDSASKLHLSLSYSKIHKLPNTLCWPSLLALDMSKISCNYRLKIPEMFFTEAKKVRYLDISGLDISSIPKSLSKLIQLCTLDMTGCINLTDVSCVGELKFLEILILDGTGIYELPKEFRNLEVLKKFSLKDTHNLVKIPPNIIKKMSLLHELNMENSFSHWEVEQHATGLIAFAMSELTNIQLGRKGVAGVNANLSEIFGLSELTTLHLDINNPLCLEQEYVFAPLDKLEKFRIMVGNSANLMNTKIEKSVSLAMIPSTLADWICRLLELSEYVHIRDWEEGATFPCKLAEEYRFNQNDPYIFPSSHSYITQGENGENVSNAAEQVVEQFDYIGNIRSVTEQRHPFDQNDLLWSFFTSSHPYLIQGDHKMENAGNAAAFVTELVEEQLDNRENIRNIGSVTEEVKEHLDNPGNFGNTTHVTEPVEHLDNLEKDACCISSVTEQVNEQLDNPENARNVGSVTEHVDKRWYDEIPNIDSTVEVLYSKLTDIQVHNCKNLRTLFLGSMNQALKNLTNIHISGCNQLLSVVDCEGPIYFEKLKSIEVKDCGKIRSLLDKAECKCLESISAARCRNLENIFSRSTLPQNLKILKVEECNKLEYSSVSSLIELSLSSIETIEVLKCHFGEVQYLLRIDNLPNEFWKKAFVNLRVLKVNGFGGKRIFRGPISSCSLKKLVEVEVKWCNRLTSIWSSEVEVDIVKDSRKPLKTLVIGYCDKLIIEEVLFALKVEKLVLEGFSQLQSLALVPEITLHHVQTLQVFNCEKLVHLVQSYSTPKQLMSLENLAINNCPCLITKHTIFPNRLGKVTIQRLPQLETFAEFIFAERCDVIRVLECRNLKNLCSYMEAGIFHDLKELVIYDCLRLSTVICEDGIVTFPNTQTKGRHELINSPSTQNVFGNLKFLFIGNCHKLTSIFSVSVARRLVNLECICVVNCDQVKEIVTLSNPLEKVIIYEDLFPCLKYLTLFWLQKLGCFCKDYGTPLQWKSLEFVCVWGCPDSVTLGMGTESAPKLKEIAGQNNWFKKFKKESFSCSRSFILSTWCRSFDIFTDSATYTQKLEGLSRSDQCLRK